MTEGCWGFSRAKRKSEDNTKHHAFKKTSTYNHVLWKDSIGLSDIKKAPIDDLGPVIPKDLGTTELHRIHNTSTPTFSYIVSFVSCQPIVAESFFQ